MSDADDVWGCVGGLLLIVVVVMAVVTAVMALVSVGSLYGAGTALRNYGLAFANNVKPERVTP
jgi:hypothetical protein